MGKSEKFGYWRDTHIRLEGSSVHMLQSVFLTDWYYTTKHKLTEDEFFPEIKTKDEKMVQIVSSGPDSDWEIIHYAYFCGIGRAKKNIYIETPYFIPDESILRALKGAALRGVDVKIVFPKVADHKMVNIASYSYFEELLKSGAKVYLYENGFIHSKMIIIDDNMFSTGSANMDLRSFMLNFEINAFVYDNEVNKEMKEKFYKDIDKSKELLLEEFMDRKISVRIKESLARLFSPIL